MRKLPLLAIACASIVFVSVNSYACTKCGSRGVGVRANSLSFTVGAGEDFFDSKRRLKNAGVPFFAVDYNFTRQWGIEGLIGFFNSTFTGEFDNGKQTNGNLILIDGVYHFAPYHVVQPYVLAGVGITSLSSNRTDANNQGNINAGLGLQFHVNEVVSFKIDARDIYTMTGGKNDIFVGAGVSLAWQLC